MIVQCNVKSVLKCSSTLTIYAIALLHHGEQCRDDCQRKASRFVRNSSLISKEPQVVAQINPTAAEVRESILEFYPSSRASSNCPDWNSTRCAVLMNCVATSASAEHAAGLLPAVRLPHTNYLSGFLHILFSARQACQLVNRVLPSINEVTFFLPENAHNDFLRDLGIEARLYLLLPL